MCKLIKWLLATLLAERDDNYTETLEQVIDLAMDRETFDRLHNLGHNGDIMAKPINLDDMEESELTIAAEHPALHADVRRYATCRLDAIKNRLAGSTQAALGLERKADYIYANYIPKHLRW